MRQNQENENDLAGRGQPKQHPGQIWMNVGTAPLRRCPKIHPTLGLFLPSRRKWTYLRLENAELQVGQPGLISLPAQVLLGFIHLGVQMVGEVPEKKEPKT